VHKGRFAKHQLDAAWGVFNRLLEYKVAERGGVIVRVDPRGTSRECNRCQNHAHLGIQDLVLRCPRCGLVADRDVNAARNILSRSKRLPGLAGEFTPVDTGGRSGGVRAAVVPVGEAGTPKAV
jgi:putative transposase